MPKNQLGFHDKKENQNDCYQHCHKGQRNDKICTCTSSAWDVDQGIMLLDHAALVVAPALKDYSVNATTAEIHAPLTVGVLRVPYCHARQRPADCRVAISAKHLTSTWRTSCTSMLSVACSEMTESSRLRFDCGPS